MSTQNNNDFKDNLVVSQHQHFAFLSSTKATDRHW